jgi:hypothetical protein
MHAQTNTDQLPSTPKDPHEIFATAAPFYDFASSELKPWHLKASYQLYDEKGKPSVQGTYEYWRASPNVYRSTWTRAGGTHTDWHTADGKHAYQSSGESLSMFEYRLQSALLSPLPDVADLNSDKSRLDRQMVPMGSTKFPCIEVIPIMPQHGQLQIVPLGWFPTYCFDPKLPILRVSFSLGSLTTEYDKVSKVQNRFLAREIQMLEGKKKLLSAQLDEVNGIAPGDPALVPPPESHEQKHEKVDIAAGVVLGMLLKKEAPIYPQDAKDAHVSGTVVLRAVIGKDGGIHELSVVSAPWPSLAASALWSVSHWQYRPYLLGDEPVEVETTINVIYTLGR